MSFSSNVKNELCKLENKKICCEKAQCYGTLLFLKFFKGKKFIQSENKTVLRNLAQTLSNLTNCIVEVKVNDARKINSLSFPNPYDTKAIKDFFSYSENRINYSNFECENCKTAFLRAAFLSCSSISDPKKQYKIEFLIADEILADEFEKFLQNFEVLSFKRTKRNDRFVFYIKDSTQLEDFLTLIGAKNSSMELMQEKMIKEVKNQINRQTNFETANIDRTMTASAKQIVAIANIFDLYGKEYLERELQKLAEFRIENPEMSLQQIAESIGISRSSVNHRLNKIITIWENLKKEG